MRPLGTCREPRFQARPVLRWGRARTPSRLPPAAWALSLRRCGLGRVFWLWIAPFLAGELAFFPRENSRNSRLAKENPAGLVDLGKGGEGGGSARIPPSPCPEPPAQPLTSTFCNLQTPPWNFPAFCWERKMGIAVQKNKCSASREKDRRDGQNETPPLAEGAVPAWKNRDLRGVAFQTRHGPGERGFSPSLATLSAGECSWKPTGWRVRMAETRSGFVGGTPCSWMRRGALAWVALDKVQSPRAALGCDSCGETEFENVPPASLMGA